MSGLPNRYDAVIATPLPGGVRLAVGLAPGGAVHTIDYLAADVPTKAPASPAARAVVAWLEGYFRDPRLTLTLPVEPAGTPFQRRVWAALGAIPAGGTQTYGAVAKAVGSAPRAVGGACRANPVPLLIPCHRVVAAGGLGGYSGSEAESLRIKAWLLAHERRAEKTFRG